MYFEYTWNTTLQYNIEYSILKFPEDFNFLDKSYLIKKGKVILTKNPGLGIKLNQEILNRHTLYKKIIN